MTTINDILTSDRNWLDWSTFQQTTYARQNQLAINLIIYAEIAVGFPKEQELITALPDDLFQRLRCLIFTSVLMLSLLILPLITRDVNRDRTYFPNVKLISPE